MPSTDTLDVHVTTRSATRSWTRFLPIAVIALGALAGAIFLRGYLSFDTLAQHYEALTAWRGENRILALAVFMTAYIAAVALSLPGATWLTLIGGFLFGTILGAIIVVVSATAGAMAIFLAARTALGDSLRSRAGAWVSRMEEGFREGQASYLLMMRLIPAVPFFIANLVPALLGARLWTYFWTTLVGIIPGTVVYISIGAGLGEQLSRGEPPDLGVIFEWHILGPLVGLAALAALPVVLRAAGVTRGASK